MVVVLGCGIAGMTSALVLADAGLPVEIWAEQRPPSTTSNVAAAFWYPYRAMPHDRVARWAAVSWHRFSALCDDPTSGVSMRRAIDLARRPQPRPWWADAVPDLRPVSQADGRGSLAHGWTFSAPVIDTRAYLPWLLERLARLSVPIVSRKLVSLTQATDVADIVVNCCGLGAKDLCGDPALFPIRGQLLHVANPGLTDVILDERDDGGIAYIVPRGDDVVLGGTAAEHDDSSEVRQGEADAILERCIRLVPELAGAVRLRDVVGIRPGRASVRLEAVRDRAGCVVHNYGHGGAGVTLSWGCAEEVAALCGAPSAPASEGAR